jgi:hypothetical protein
MTSRTRLTLRKTGWVFDFSDCEDVVDGITDVFQGWKTKRSAAAAPAPAARVATVSYRDNAWHWRVHKKSKPRYWDPLPPKETLRVVNDLLDASIYWHLEENPNDLCLHAAAAEIGNGLVCFPALHQAGKSTLMAALSAQGMKVFGDDVIALRRGRGVSFGFLTRLRVPLPATLGESLRTYIETHKGPANHKWIYVKPDDPAQFGDSKPIKAFVLLQRQPGEKARLEPARDVDVMKRLLSDNIIRVIPLIQIFDRMHRLCKSKPKYHLIYSDPEEAARLLIERFY